MKIDDFYSQLRAGASTHTTQITPIVFMDYFEELIKSNLDILYISFHQDYGTYNTTVGCRRPRHKYPDRKIYSVDSKCASIGEGLLVLNSAMQKKKGLTIEELRDWVEDHKYDSRHWFTVRDLFHLKRGGRVSSIEAVVGTALRIRPILSTNEEGRLVVVSKIRGAKAEMDFLINKMTEEGEDLSSQIVIVGHGDNLEQAKQLEKQIRSMNIIKDVVIAQIGPIIGSHTGPDMLALVYMGKK